MPEPNRQQRDGVADLLCDEMIPNLFHDADQRAWIRLPNSITLTGGDTHYETYAIDSRELRRFLMREYWCRMKALYGRGEVMDQLLIASRLEYLTARALFDGPEQPVFLRVGEDERNIYIDLCDDKWRAVKISPDGWEIVGQPEVFFRRAQGMLPLPLPERGGSLDELKDFINVSSDQFVLVKAWLLATMRPNRPYPLLAAIGAAGSAKSNLCRMLRALIDPNSSPDNSPPREMRDLNTMALGNHVLSYDNFSRISPQLSDSLCRLATGSSTVERRLRTNNEPVRYPKMYRPILLNGVTEFITAPDLLDRSIILALRHVTNRRTEASIWQGFNAKRGRIFGGMLDLLVKGVRNLPNTNVSNLPRMAEFAQWAIACGIEDFENRYRQNLIDSSLALLEDDPLPMAIKGIMEWQWGKPLEITAPELVPALEVFNYTAANPRALSADLRRLAPALRTGLGIAVEFPRRTSDRRVIRLSKV